MARMVSQTARGQDVVCLRAFVVRPAIAIASVLTIGTVGYSAIEEWPVLDALYMTVITLSTVGFGEVAPMTGPGREFTIGLVLVSVVAVGWAVASLTSFVVEGHLSGVILERRRRWVLSQIRGHIVVCGLGRVGIAAVRKAREQGTVCVGIEEHAQTELPPGLEDVMVVGGNATRPEILLQAGVNRAKGVICALRTDAENIMLALQLQELAPDALVVARADTEEADELLRRAGADVVISPYRTGGERMAGAINRPGVHSYMEVVNAGRSASMHLEEVEIVVGSPHIGATLAQLQAIRDSDARVVAIGKPWGEPVLNPRGSTLIAEGDRLIIAGTDEQIREFHEVLSHRPA